MTNQLGRPLKLKNATPELLMEMTAQAMKGSERCTNEELRQILAEIQETSLRLQRNRRPRSARRVKNVHLSMLLTSAARMN